MASDEIDQSSNSVERTLYVETAPFPQTVECPECGTSEQMYITSEQIAGYGCRGCGAEVRFRHDRDDGNGGDETEQTQLVTDGGTERCPACGTEVTDPNPESDHWYCESGKCEVIIFGPRGLDGSRDTDTDRSDRGVEPVATLPLLVAIASLCIVLALFVAALGGAP